MGTRRTIISVHGVPVNISVDRLLGIFAWYSEVEEVSAWIATYNIDKGQF